MDEEQRMIKMIIGFLLVGVGFIPVSYAVEAKPATLAAIQTININTASAKQLSQFLPGIGPSKATALVVYRKRFGDYKSIDDVVKVDGVSAPTLENIKPFIRLTDEPPVEDKSTVKKASGTTAKK